MVLWLYNKEADWPVAGQDKVRRENEIKDTGKKGGSLGVTEEAEHVWNEVTSREPYDRT